jgi:hypothetical protein
MDHGIYNMCLLLLSATVLLTDPLHDAGRFMDGFAGARGMFRKVSRHGKIFESIAKSQTGEIGILL